MKSDIENIKWVFQIEDDGRIKEKCTCVQLIAINKIWSNFKTTLFNILFGVRKGKAEHFSYQLRPLSNFFLQFTQY